MPRALKRTDLATYRFPLGGNDGAGKLEPTRGAVLSRTSFSSDAPSLEYPWGYIIVFGVPLIMIGALFGIGAGASLVDHNITMHPANVLIIWLVNLIVYVLIGLVWSVFVEDRLNRFYFRKWGTNREQFEDADFAEGEDYLQTVNRRPPQRTFWMAPLMYIIMSLSDTFLVIIPAIEWPNKAGGYSYWIALFRGLVKGFGTGGTTGMLLGYTVPYWPLELSFLQMTVGAFQTMLSCSVTVGIGEAWNVTRPGPILSLGD